MRKIPGGFQRRPHDEIPLFNPRRNVSQFLPPLKMSIPCRFSVVLRSPESWINGRAPNLKCTGLPQRPIRFQPGLSKVEGDGGSVWGISILSPYSGYNWGNSHAPLHSLTKDVSLCNSFPERCSFPHELVGGFEVSL